LAWAVGDYYDTGLALSRTLILKWNGRDWSVVPSPNRGTGSNSLSGVTVISSTNAWAVGSFNGVPDDKTLILHWNGTAWKVVKSPNPVSDSFNNLYDVDAAGPNDIWAVGEGDDSGGYRPLLLHWNGDRWRSFAPPPIPGDNDEIYEVAVRSSQLAWAVGYQDPGAGAALVLRWNGTRWKRADTPTPGTSSILRGVSVAPDGTAWAVGEVNGGRSLVLRWHGGGWKRQKLPHISDYDYDSLSDVVAASATKAWAVGWSLDFGVEGTLVLRWNGKTWSRQPSPYPDTGQNELYGVTKIPRGGLWAVGTYDQTPYKNLIVHCC
jgi:hypothetical protein